MHYPRVEILDLSLYNYYQRNTSITVTRTDKVLDVDKAIIFINDKLIDNNIYESNI